jgi:hypothetical protein
MSARRTADATATHADGRLRMIPQAGGLQYDPRMEVHRCPDCEQPGVIVQGFCVLCARRRGIPIPMFTAPRRG